MKEGLSVKKFYLYSEGENEEDERIIKSTNLKLRDADRQEVTGIEDIITYVDMECMSLRKHYEHYCNRNKLPIGKFKIHFISGIPMVDMIECHDHKIPFGLIFSAKDIYYLDKYDTIHFDLMFDFKKNRILASAALLDILDYKKMGEHIDVKIRENSRSFYRQTYLMLDKISGYYKIGRSVNPSVRESTLQSQLPEIELVCKCKVDIEKHLHEKYAEKRIRGEWFRLTNSDVKNIIKRFNEENKKMAIS